MTDHPKTWTPERLIDYPLITDVDLSPDGRRIAYALREPVLTEEQSKFVSHLYCVSVDGGDALRLTYGQASNTMPRWSPDGRHLAFLSDRDGKRNVHVLNASGGESWPLTQVEKHVQAFAWSPDGSRLALSMVPPDSEARKKAKKAKDDPLHWGVEHERAWLWVLPFVQGDAGLPEMRPLTGDDRHVLRLSWTDAGDEIVFSHQPTPIADDWPEAGLAVVSATLSTDRSQDVAHESDSAERPIRELGLVSAQEPQPEVHGRWVACTSGVDPVRWTIIQRVRLFSLDGDVSLPLATTPDDRPHVAGWSADGEHVLVFEADKTASAVYALPTDGGEPIALLRGEGYLSDVRANKAGQLALVRQTSQRMNHLCVANPEGEGAAARLIWQEVLDPTPADWPHEAIPRTEILHWPSEAGEIDGLVTYPLNPQTDGPYPTLVIVHGGPMSFFSETYVAGPGLYPIATFAERGYAVLRVNPRGSGGYGRAFREANLRDWGGGDLRDILAGVDLLIERGIADPERLGIMGWSYGGFMTSWTITQTDRFRAASVGAGVTNLVSMTGTSDIPNFLPHYMGAEFWDDLDIYRQCSAMFNIKGVRTPTLIQHGQKDIRVPLGQGVELYNALKRQGVPVEMFIYPRQQHGPHEPRLIMDIVRRNVAWFDRWLLNEEPAP